MMLTEKQAQEYSSRPEIVVVQELENLRKVESYGVIKGDRLLIKIEMDMGKLEGSDVESAEGVSKQQIKDQEIYGFNGENVIQRERIFRETEEKQHLLQVESLRSKLLTKDFESDNENEEEPLIREELGSVKQEENEEELQSGQSQKTYQGQKTYQMNQVSSYQESSQQQNMHEQQLGGLKQKQSYFKFTKSTPKDFLLNEADMQEEDQYDDSDDDDEDRQENQNKDEDLSNINNNGCLPKNSLYQSQNLSRGLKTVNGTHGNCGHWTKEEHRRFIEGLQLFGKNWKKVESHVGSRTGAQVRSHAQKFFNKQERQYNKTHRLRMNSLSAQSSLYFPTSQYYHQQGQYYFQNFNNTNQIGASPSWMSGIKKNLHKLVKTSIINEADLINPRLPCIQSNLQGNILTERYSQNEGCKSRLSVNGNKNPNLQDLNNLIGSGSIFPVNKSLITGNIMNNENDKNQKYPFPTKINNSKQNTVRSSINPIPLQLIQQQSNRLIAYTHNTQEQLQKTQLSTSNDNQIQKNIDFSTEAPRPRSDSSVSNFTTASNSLMDQITGSTGIHYETNIITSTQIPHDSQQINKNNDYQILDTIHNGKDRVKIEAITHSPSIATSGCDVLPIIPHFLNNNTINLQQNFSTNQQFNSILPFYQITNYCYREAPSFYSFALKKYGESIFNYPSLIFSLNSNQQPIISPNDYRQQLLQKQLSFRLHQKQDQMKLDLLTKKICHEYEKTNNIQGISLQDKSINIHRNIIHQQNEQIHGKNIIIQSQDQLNPNFSEQESKKLSKTQDVFLLNQQTNILNIFSKVQPLILNNEMNNTPNQVANCISSNLMQLHQPSQQQQEQVSLLGVLSAKVASDSSKVC